MGAGILPVALYRGTLFVLLGQERYNNNLWVDFGGSSTNTERKNPFKTAIREGSEELNGLYGTEEYLINTVSNNLLLTLTNKDDKYTTYLFKTNYDTKLPHYFVLQNSFIEKHLQRQIVDNHNGLFEKIKIKWYSIDELKNTETKKMIRPYYLMIINSIIKNERLLKSKILNK